MRTTVEPRAAHRRLGRKACTAAFAVLVLAAAGAALASPQPASVNTVSATFSATPVGTPNTQTCTGANGNTYQLTAGTFSGTASGTDPNLSGTIRLDVNSVYDTTTNLGWLDANVQIQSSTAGDGANAEFVGVDVANSVQGMLIGQEQNPATHLLGSLTAGFTAAGGFSSGTFGAGSATNTAIAASGGCAFTPPPRPTPPQPIHKLPWPTIHPLPQPGFGPGPANDNGNGNGNGNKGFKQQH